MRSEKIVDDEAKERARQEKAAWMRAYRAQKNAKREGEPKRQRGGQPTDTPHIARKIYLTEEEWTFCKAQPGGGSEFVRQLVVEYIAANGEAAGVVQSEDGGAVD